MEPEGFIRRSALHAPATRGQALRFLGASAREAKKRPADGGH